MRTPNPRLKSSIGYGLYFYLETTLSLLKANEHSELVSERIRKEIGNDKIEVSSIFTAIWYPQLCFNPMRQDIMCLKINYRTYDGGTNNKLEDIKTLDK